MKRILATGMAAFAIVFYSAAALGQKAEETKLPPETRHIKLVKIVDGKKMTLDTVIAGTDLFVWQGDTVYPPRHSENFGPEGPRRMHRFDIRIDEKDGKKQTMIFDRRGPDGMDPFVWQTDSDDFDLMDFADGDSLDHKIVIHKRIKDGDEEHRFDFGRPDFNHFVPVPPVPPMPPVPHIKMLKHFSEGNVIDLNDPEILSYKKKNLSGGREKIEIIRKKSDKADMTFEFQGDDKFAAPEMKGDVRQIKIEEKKVKTDKKIAKPAEPEDNK